MSAMYVVMNTPLSKDDFENELGMHYESLHIWITAIVLDLHTNITYNLTKGGDFCGF